jgi:hypothetical protein
MTGITSFHLADRSPEELRRNGSASTRFEGNPIDEHLGAGSGCCATARRSAT